MITVTEKAAKHIRKALTTKGGVGLRLGASLGYLSYSRRRNVIPF